MTALSEIWPFPALKALVRRSPPREPTPEEIAQKRSVAVHHAWNTRRDWRSLEPYLKIANQKDRVRACFRYLYTTRGDQDSLSLPVSRSAAYGEEIHIDFNLAAHAITAELHDRGPLGLYGAAIELNLNAIVADFKSSDMQPIDEAFVRIDAICTHFGRHLKKADYEITIFYLLRTLGRGDLTVVNAPEPRWEAKLSMAMKFATRSRGHPGLRRAELIALRDELFSKPLYARRVQELL